MNQILLQAAAAPNQFVQFIPIVGMLIVGYFFLIRPQQQKQKQQKKFLEALKKGDEVVTVGGLHGKITSLNDTTVTLETDNKGTKITFDRSSVARTASVA